ncbi:MAG: hypothetical protein JW810_01310 [Sedimentisphaerales bacterium]|nr:hypothetical protein [Sedimentisphaerales bacterium]
MIEQWEVQRSEGLCAGTGRKLEPGEEYYAALIDKKTHFERRDYCRQYWQDQKPEVYSFWMTRMPLPTQKKKLFVDDQVLINLFERLAEETDGLKLNFRFVLALILMRKKLLKYEDSRRQGAREIWTMRFVKETQQHEVINPNLDEEKIQEVSQELGAILQGQFE